MSWFKRDKGDDDKLPTLNEKDRKVRTEGLWQKCEGCRQIIWKKDLETNCDASPKTPGKKHRDTNWNFSPRCGAHSRTDAFTPHTLLPDDAIFTRHDTE